MLSLIKDEWVFSNLNYIKLRSIINWLNTWICMFICLSTYFFYNVKFSFLMMKLWAFGNQKNVDMPLMFKGYLIVSSHCQVFASLGALNQWVLVYFFHVDFKIVFCFDFMFYKCCWFWTFCCYMWIRNMIFMKLLIFCFHDPHWFNDYSLPHICFFFFNIIINLLVLNIMGTLCCNEYNFYDGGLIPP